MADVKICLNKNDKNKWLSLPALSDEVQSALSEIGATDGEYVISDCEAGFGDKLKPIILRANLNAVNYLAARLAALSSANIELLDAMLESPLRHEILYNINRVIDFADNTGAYEIYRGIHNAETLARHYIYHSGLVQMPLEWVDGIDFEKFGKNLEKHEPGHYTRYGYLIATGLDWKPVFENSGEIPAEYCIIKQ